MGLIPIEIKEIPGKNNNCLSQGARSCAVSSHRNSHFFLSRKKVHLYFSFLNAEIYTENTLLLDELRQKKTTPNKTLNNFSCLTTNVSVSSRDKVQAI